MKLADRVFSGGLIRTMDPANPVVEAVAVREGKIIAAGSRADVEALAGPDTDRVDLEGKIMLPGFVP